MRMMFGSFQLERFEQQDDVDLGLKKNWKRKTKEDVHLPCSKALKVCGAQLW